MKKMELSIVGGALLILAGSLYLLDSLGILESGAAMLWTVLFAVGGLYACLIAFQDREKNWWAIIPGFLGLGLAATISVSTYLPRVPEEIPGSFVLIALGLSFWTLYLWKREFWWSIIPAGVLSTLAFVTAISNFVTGNGIAGILFFGLGLTFALIYVLPTAEARMTWALFPAGILGGMGILMTAAAMDLYRYVWPILFIGLGGMLIARTLLSKKHREPLEDPPELEQEETSAADS